MENSTFTQLFGCLNHMSTHLTNTTSILSEDDKNLQHNLDLIQDFIKHHCANTLLENVHVMKSLKKKFPFFKNTGIADNLIQKNNTVKFNLNSFDTSTGINVSSSTVYEKIFNVQHKFENVSNMLLENLFKNKILETTTKTLRARVCKQQPKHQSTINQEQNKKILSDLYAPIIENLIRILNNFNNLCNHIVVSQR